MRSPLRSSAPTDGAATDPRRMFACSNQKKLKIEGSAAPEPQQPATRGRRSRRESVSRPRAGTPILSRIPLKLIAFAGGDARCLKTQLTGILFPGCGDTDLSWRALFYACF